MPRNLTSSRYNVAFFLLLLWVGATAFNITKAVHIDDTAYLEIARIIVADPLHPMSGLLNWGNTAEPVHLTNQPHLLFYPLAAIIAVFGESEFLFHALIAVFSLVSIVVFYLLARHFAPRHALWLSAFFASGPAFIPSQNIMCDIPMLALWLVFFWAILTPAPESKLLKRYLIAGFAVGAACLIKYLSLVLLPILLLDIILKKRWRLLWTLAIPISILVGWSVFNYLDYGGIHLLERREGGGRFAEAPRRILDWLTCLGSVSPFALVGIPYLLAHPRRRYGLIASALCGLLSFFWSFLFWGDDLVTCLLRALFIGNGLLLLSLTIACIAEHLREKETHESPDSRTQTIILAAWILATGAFIVLFSPFMAVRHILPVIPAILLLTGRPALDAASIRWRQVGLISTVFLGFALGFSDWRLANIYREQAHAIRSTLPRDAKIWFLGHWGWQWYAGKVGMQQYDIKNSVLQTGDFLVAPHMLQSLGVDGRDSASLKERTSIPINAGTGDLFRTMITPGGYYAGGYRALPWTISQEPLELFKVYEMSP
jgi:4-amino-4-deoxy-L-arabinose transferase-like glycosyltransferase